jgi:hypothetical protein
VAVVVVVVRTAEATQEDWVVVGLVVMRVVLQETVPQTQAVVVEEGIRTLLV